MNDRALHAALATGAALTLLGLAACQSTPAPEPASTTDPQSKSKPAPKPGPDNKQTTKIHANPFAKSSPPPANSTPPAQAQTKTGKLTATAFGRPFAPVAAELLAFANPDTAGNGAAQDKAQKYHLEIRDHEDTFESTNELTIIFATDWGKPLDNLKIDWKPTAFGSEEHRRQAYPKSKASETSVGRGIYSVIVEANGETEFDNDEIAATIHFGKEQAGQIPLTIRFRSKNSSVEGTALVKVQRR